MRCGLRLIEQRAPSPVDPVSLSNLKDIIIPPCRCRRDVRSTTRVTSLGKVPSCHNSFTSSSLSPVISFIDQSFDFDCPWHSVFAAVQWWRSGKGAWSQTTPNNQVVRLQNPDDEVPDTKTLRAVPYAWALHKRCARSRRTLTSAVLSIQHSSFFAGVYA